MELAATDWQVQECPGRRAANQAPASEGPAPMAGCIRPGTAAASGPFSHETVAGKAKTGGGSMKPKPYVSVTLEGPDDGGDFGRNTPGTRTGGIQEALDYAHAHSRDVWIWGGRGGVHDGVGSPHNIYTLEETLRVPWSQDFRLDGGNYLLAYTGESGHAIHFDSQMNCRYKFGLVSSGSPDAVVAIRPENPGPDDFTCVTASVFDFACAVSSHPRGTGILLDSSHGPIVNSKLFAEETNTRGTGLHLSDGNGRATTSATTPSRSSTETSTTRPGTAPACASATRSRTRSGTTGSPSPSTRRGRRTSTRRRGATSRWRTSSPTMLSER